MIQTLLLKLRTSLEKMKIASIIGTRPQIIKLFPIQMELARREIEHIVINTGQHYMPELSENLFLDLGISQPAYNLTINSNHNPSRTRQTTQMLNSIQKVLEIEKPDKVLVYGDTNSTLAASVVCAKEGYFFAHVEAGLRSNDRKMPEEINRVITDHLASFNFPPTQTADAILQKEGLGSNKLLVGDIMLDTFLILKSKIENLKYVIKNLNLPSSYLVLTLHRPSNVDDMNRLSMLLSKINAIGKKIIFPAHPRTLKNLNLTTSSYKNIMIVPPMPYIEFAALLTGADGLLTDSGGLQKEAYFNGIPTLTIRNSTEWPETLVEGQSILDVDLDSLNLFSQRCESGKFFVDYELFGSGNARLRIIDFLVESSIL